MNNASRELEWKLRTTAGLAADAVEHALRTATAGMATSPARTATHVDTYLDDGECSLLRQGMGLRVRRGADGATVCCKDRGSQHNGLHDRRELELPWTLAATPGTARDLPQQLADAVEPRLRNRPLQQLVQIEVAREQRRISDNGAPLAVFVIDRAIARGRGRQASFCELELEVLGDPDACARIAGRLCASLPVERARDDKLASSLHQLAMAPTPIEPAPPTMLGELLSVRLRRLFDALGCAEAAVRASGSPDSVHAMRTALRRTRVLVRAFRAAWTTDHVAHAELALANAARKLAGVRETDAFAAHLPRLLDDLPAPLRRAEAGLDDLLAASRRESLQVAIEHLRTPSHQDAMAAVERLADASAMLPEVADLPDHAAEARVRQSARAVRRTLRALPERPTTGDLHALRLQMKRLRVLTEEFGGDHRLRGRRRRRLGTALQRLGVVGDQRAATAWCLEQLQDEAPDHGMAALLGAVATHLQLGAPIATQAAVRALQRWNRRGFWRWFRRSRHGKRGGGPRP